MFKKRWLLPLILVLGISLTACTNTPPEEENPIEQDEEDGVTDTNNDQNDNDSEDDQDNTSDNEDINTEYEIGEISPEDAYDIFKEEYPEIKVNKLAIDESDGRYFYKVKGFDGSKEYEVKINMEDGNRDKEEERENDLMGEEIKKEDLGKIEEFLKKSLDDAGSGYMIQEWELESKDKGFILDIEIVDENKENDKEYKYNIGTGELIEKD